MLTAQLDRQMERHIDGQTRQYNNEESWHILQLTLIVIFINKYAEEDKPLRRTDRRTDIWSDGVNFDANKERTFPDIF